METVENEEAIKAAVEEARKAYLSGVESALSAGKLAEATYRMDASDSAAFFAAADIAVSAFVNAKQAGVLWQTLQSKAGSKPAA